MQCNNLCGHGQKQRYFFPMPRRMTSPARVDGRFLIIRCRTGNSCAATSSSSFRGSQTIDSTFSSRRSVKVRPSSCPYLFCPATDCGLPISAQTDDTWCRPTENCTSCPSTRRAKNHQYNYRVRPTDKTLTSSTTGRILLMPSDPSWLWRAWPKCRLGAGKRPSSHAPSKAAFFFYKDRRMSSSFLLKQTRTWQTGDTHVIYRSYHTTCNNIL